jgi:hypothetical protein
MGLLKTVYDFSERDYLAMADLGDELPPEMLADIGLVLEP